MRKISVLLASIFFLTPAFAESPINKWKRYAVGDQNISLVFAAFIEKDCSPKGESRLAIVIPPKNGKISSKYEKAFSYFTDSGEYAKCNNVKTDGLRVIYTANPGFKGNDKFTFITVYNNGSSRRYEIDMTVW